MDENNNTVNIRKKIFSMIFPITIENVLQMTAGFVSMAMIGRISAIAVAAIGLSMRITQIIWALFKGITTGATVFVAQATGSKDHKKLRQVVQQTLLSTVIFVVILQQLIYWNAALLLEIFNPKIELMESALIYLRNISWGLPFMAIMLVVAGVLQGMGNAKTPMKIALTMNFINIVLSFVLIFGHFGLPALGIKGAALATVISQAVGAFIGLYVLFNSEGVLCNLTNRSFFNLNLKQVVDVYKVGMPTAFESIFWQIAAIILTKLILSFGETSLAAYQLGLQAESISYMPAIGFSIAATTFIGQTLGASKGDLGKKYLSELIKGTILITSISTIVLIYFPSNIMRLLTNDIEVVKIGAQYLFLMGLVQLPQNLSGVINGALRGAGFTQAPMIVAGVGLWGVRIPLAMLLTLYFDFAITAIWIAICIDLVFRFILSCMLYKSKNIYKTGKLILEETNI
jgi:putative MATE family efflux protein